MTEEYNKITILTCHDRGCRASKKFIKHEDGSIKIESYKAGKYFTHREVTVSSIQDIRSAIEDISNEQRQFIIRGKIKENAPNVVRRKTHEPDAAFDSVARPYIMLDIDKLECPDFFDIKKNPQQAIQWVLDTLPKPFRNVSCFYQFSSSQNVPKNIENKPKNQISVHLWFWCNRPTSDDEWKRYFKSVSSHVDSSLFSAVQPHFTAKPIFENMEDPLPQRSGVFNGNFDVLIVPEIPDPKPTKVSNRADFEPVVDEEEIEKALDLLSSYYQSGTRNRFSGAIASILYRGGWSTENTSEFLRALAERNNDEESHQRYNNSINICDAIDNNLPVQGVPTLRNEFKVKELDEILNLLGLGKPDITTIISTMNNQSTILEIKNTLQLLLSFSEAEQRFYLDEISRKTLQQKGSLKELLKEVAKELSQVPSDDPADILMETILAIEYNDGQDLLYTSDKSYWHYNGCFWEMIPSQQIKQVLLPHIREFIATQEQGSVAGFNNTILNILEGRAFRPNDPLGQLNQNPPPVINCQNGELWFDENGDFELRPHRADSYLRSCLNIHYDPAATSPMFNKAVLEIFSNSSNPEEMFRHFMELAGYICQPWRKLATIVLLYGGGSNGKTSLVKVIRRMLGENTIMSDRLDNIEGNDFKIGGLDGKLLLLDDDVDGGTSIPDGFLKKISEEKIMTGQHKHKPTFEFICRAMPMMLANDYPVTSDLTKGLRRRLMVIPFKRTFEADDIKTDLFDTIWEQEASGILNHIVLGFQHLKKRGRFQEPKDCLEAKDEWISRANILTTYIKEECILDSDYREHLGDFYNAFKIYCQEAGVRNVQTRRGVEGRLEALGYRISILNGKKAVWGLKRSTPEQKRTEKDCDIHI